MNDPRVQRLIDWVAQRQGTGGAEIGPDTDLLASGILDSIGMVSLFFLVETMGGAPVDPAEAAAAGPITPASVVARYL
jgi:hypothetical protein